jgi:Na+/H+ antiporter NhaD/arsenite permease-like protein
MTALLILTFVLGYICIAMENTLRIDKAAIAIITGTLCWVWIVLGFPEAPAHLAQEFSKFTAETGETISGFWDHRLLHHMEDIAGILLFLMGAMTIVEIVDAHEGFRVITDRITARKKVHLLWIVGVIAFFLSAVLDNLTTSIVMVSLLRKLIADQKTRWLFGGVIIIAANAGGAWSPIGDVTTTMLWIGKQITAAEIIPSLFVVSLIHLLVPLSILSFVVKGSIQPPGSLKAHNPAHPAKPTGILPSPLG